MSTSKHNKQAFIFSNFQVETCLTMTIQIVSPENPKAIRIFEPGFGSHDISASLSNGAPSKQQQTNICLKLSGQDMSDENQENFESRKSGKLRRMSRKSKKIFSNRRKKKLVSTSENGNTFLGQTRRNLLKVITKKVFLRNLDIGNMSEVENFESKLLKNLKAHQKV